MRKLKLGTLIFSGFVILILFGCDPYSNNKMFFYDRTKSIDLSSENVNSISLNSDEKNVIYLFGKPDKITEITNPKSKYLTYNGIEFGIMKNKVIRYYFDKEYQTSKGISIRETKEKAIKMYGKNYYERSETGQDIIGYFDKKNKMNIEFTFNENKVVGVMIEKIGWKEN